MRHFWHSQSFPATDLTTSTWPSQILHFITSLWSVRCLWTRVYDSNRALKDMGKKYKMGLQNVELTAILLISLHLLTPSTSAWKGSPDTLIPLAFSPAVAYTPYCVWNMQHRGSPDISLWPKHVLLAYYVFVRAGGVHNRGEIRRNDLYARVLINQRT